MLDRAERPCEVQLDHACWLVPLGLFLHYASEIRTLKTLPKAHHGRVWTPRLCVGERGATPYWAGDQPVVLHLQPAEAVFGTPRMRPRHTRRQNWEGRLDGAFWPNALFMSPVRAFHWLLAVIFKEAMMPSMVRVGAERGRRPVSGSFPPSDRCLGPSIEPSSWATNCSAPRHGRRGRY